MGHGSLRRPAGSPSPAPPRSGRRRCRWAPAAGPTSSSGCGPAGRSAPSPPAARTGWCRWPTATVVDGRLQCPAHGWRFDADGRCVGHPLARRRTARRRRAPTCAMPWAVEERHGWVWIAPERTSSSPHPAGERPAPRARCRRRTAPTGPVFGNLDPSLEHAWHPVALSRELRTGGWLQVRLLGRTWTLRRDGDGAAQADPPAFGVRERLGVLWLAPAEPADVALEVPEADDRPVRRAAGCRRCAPRARPDRWPTPSSTPTHGPFVHARRSAPRTAGGRPPTTLDPRARRLPQRPGAVVRQPARPGRRHRRAAAAAAPADHLRPTGRPSSSGCGRSSSTPGATTTILYLLQPEDADSTRIYVCLLLSAGPGQPLPAPADRRRAGGAAAAGARGGRRARRPRWQRRAAPRPARRGARARRRAAASRCARRCATSSRRAAAAAGRLSRLSRRAASAPQAGQRVGRVLVGQPPAGRADPAQPAGRVAALVVVGSGHAVSLIRPPWSDLGWTRGSVLGTTRSGRSAP